MLKTTSPLGRPLDFGYSSNVLVVATAVAVAIVYGAAQNVLGLSPASSWWGAGGAVFLAWAIARELDPDHTAAATLAMGLVAILAALVQPPLLFTFGVLTGLRLTAGTVGLPLKSLDAVAAIGIAGLVGLGEGGLIAAGVLAVGVVVVGERSRASLGIATAVLAVASIAATVGGPAMEWTSPGVLSFILAVAASLSLTMTVPAAEPRTPCDVGQRVITGRRLTVARWTAWGGVMLAIAFYGGIGAALAAPVVAAATGVATVRLWRAVTRIAPVRRVRSVP